MLLLLLFITIPFAIIFYNHLIKPHQYWNERGVKQRPTVFFFGHILNIVLRKESLIEFIQRTYHAYPNTRFESLSRYTQHFLLDIALAAFSQRIYMKKDALVWYF